MHRQMHAARFLILKSDQALPATPCEAGIRMLFNTISRLWQCWSGYMPTMSSGFTQASNSAAVR